jgi:hypothetical protein
MSDTQRERLPDIYWSLDYSVLLDIGRWELDGRPNGVIQPRQIAQRLAKPEREVQAAIGRLWRRGYIDAADNSTLAEGEDYMVRRMLPAGLEETGPYPKPEDLAAALSRVLKAQADQLARTDPERGKKARQVLELLGDLGTSFSAKLAAELIKASAMQG